jgi:glutamate N-acetyltransferase/amino-acid N-acetyltransferase
MVMDTLALAVSATANYVLRHQESRRMLLPLVAFPLCGVADLFCIYHELKAVQLRSLNRERAEMVAEFWLNQGKVSFVGASAFLCIVVLGCQSCI